ncbi:MAG: hypothetical protein AAB263_09700 [Planctomycetota bacterium]
MRLIILVSLIMCQGCQRDEEISNNKITQEKQWVEIQVRLKNDKTSYNYGWMFKSKWDEIVSKGDLPKYIHLNDVHWYSDDGVVLLESESRTGEYMRISSGIEFIYPTKPENIEKLRADEKKAEEKKKQDANDKIKNSENIDAAKF